ncbi:corticotropin-releasing factor-binding protein-like isoform X2 [Clavelina lepadiformis]
MRATKELFAEYLLLTFLVSPLRCQPSNDEDQAQIITGPGPTEPYSISSRSLNCVDMAKVDSDLTFVQTDESQALCGVYLIGDVHEIISVEVLEAKVDCDQGEFLEIFDGWMARGNILPSDGDHALPLEKRIVGFCERQRARYQTALTFTSTQNVALVQFRLYMNSEIKIRFRRIYATSLKCNVVTPTTQGRYTMYSVQGRSCTFSIIQPTLLEVEEVLLSSENVNATRHDTIEILKGDSLDTAAMTLVQRYQAPYKSDGLKKFVLDQSHAAVRMTSFGFHDNTIKFKYTKMSDAELNEELCT